MTEPVKTHPNELNFYSHPSLLLGISLRAGACRQQDKEVWGRNTDLFILQHSFQQSQGLLYTEDQLWPGTWWGEATVPHCS